LVVDFVVAELGQVEVEELVQEEERRGELGEQEAWLETG